MAKVDPNFKHDVYRFIHRPIRESDAQFANLFLERFIFGFQRQLESVFDRIDTLPNLWDPALTPQPRLLKDIVGFTAELDNITNDITDEDLRRLISLAVPLWKQKGLDVGYRNIIRLFTGKNSRTFNWFDFRWIVGETIIGQDELGTDTWVISTPNITATSPAGNVVLLLPLEGDTFDRSLTRAQPVLHGSAFFFDVGPVFGSEKYMHLTGAGAIRVPWSTVYDFSGDFTFEIFVRTNLSQNTVIFNATDGSRQIEIRLRSDTNQIIYTLDDGVGTFTETLAVVADIDDNIWRHLALIVDRTANTARLFYDGTEATTGLDITAMGDLTMTGTGDIYVGAASVSTDRFVGDIDGARVSLSAQYDVTTVPLPVPSVAYIEFREEELDEFYTDVRIVDNGDVNRVLVKRILNLMRPPSERLRIIYIQFFENFTFGKGDLVTVVTGSTVVNGVLRMPPLAVEAVDIAGSDTFQDIVLQVRIKITSGDLFGIRFHVQDTQNYYLATIDQTNDEMKLFKVEAGVPTQLGITESQVIGLNTYYIFTVITDFNPFLGTTLIKTLLDSNLVHSVFDDTYDLGSWALECGAGSAADVDQVEMFTTPLDIDTIQPNEVI